MPEAPSPGQVACEAYVAAWNRAATRRANVILPLPWWRLSPVQQEPWEAAAQAVLLADSDGRHTTTAMFRYGIGDVLRLAGSPCPWTVRSRRWVEREVLQPYAEYHVVAAPEDLTCWEVEADLEPWEDTDDAS